MSVRHFQMLRKKCIFIYLKLTIRRNPNISGQYDYTRQEPHMFSTTCQARVECFTESEVSASAAILTGPLWTMSWGGAVRPATCWVHSK